MLIYLLTLFSTDRIKLLLHIIRNLGPYGITADKLKDVAGDTKRSLKHASDVEIIYEILGVRKMEERFERDEVDANMVFYTMSRGPSLKGDEEDDSATSMSTEEPEHSNQRFMNPIPPFEQASTSLNTHIDNIPSAHPLPSRLSLREPFKFENPARQDPAYYATPPQYSYSSSQSMLDTPLAAEITSPQDASVPASDYSDHNTYSSSTPGVSGHCDTWASSFRQNIFSPVDYATPVSSQGMPHPLMSYQFPTVSHVHDMSHPAQLATQHEHHPPKILGFQYDVTGPPAS